MMMEAQIHRGPDDSGIYSDSHIVLGHRRLSILDLSGEARQPMSNRGGTVHIVYNGEIYNYRELRSDLETAGCKFRTQSDTEVLLQGYETWGMEVLLRRVCGMFAFAVYDRTSAESRLFLARDRMGIKPLYYTRDSDCIAFASEVKALIRARVADTNVNRDAVAGFLLFGSVPSPATWYESVRCLPAAHYVLVSMDGCRESCYWKAGTEIAGYDLAESLSLAVRQHLLSDVPLGVFLSGGMDSAAVTALASREQATALKTLTVKFNETEFDESAIARETAQHFGTDHQEVTITSKDFIDQVPDLLRAMDQPAHDGVNTYFIARAARQSGLKVVLSGLGGDELFWGYPHYHRLGAPEGALARLLRMPPLMRSALAHGMATYGTLSGQERFQRAELLSSEVTAAALYRLVRGFFAPRQVARLLDATEEEINRIAVSILENATAGSPAEQLNALELRHYLHNQLLRDTDVFSMAHSIEVRVPLLDHRVVEAAMASSQPRVAGNRNKPVLADAVGDSRVQDLARLKKRGFTFPFAKWMRHHAAELEQLAPQNSILNPKATARLWHNFRSGRLHWSRAWALTAMGSSRPKH